MTVFVCIDDKLGLAFNNRRQSRDSAVVAKIVEMTGDARLLMSAYSAKIFNGHSITVDENCLRSAALSDCCFAEKAYLAEYKDKIDRLVVFKWNKVYPSDKKLDIDLSERKMTETFDFVGNSHDKITCEVWCK